MRIAVTGGIAEGKSTVMRYLQELGQATDSADEAARRIFMREEVQQRLRELLGVDGALAPSLVRERIAANPKVRRNVNRIMHPLIARELMASPAAWIEVPLLFESVLQPLFDRVWVVACGPDQQLLRLTERLGNVEAARLLIGTQLPSAVKCAFADEIIRTDVPEESVKAIVRTAVAREFAK